VAVEVDQQLNQEDKIEGIIDRQEGLFVLRISGVDLGLLDRSIRGRRSLSARRPLHRDQSLVRGDSGGEWEVGTSGHTHHGTDFQFHAAVPAQGRGHGHTKIAMVRCGKAVYGVRLT
jgi:hypothetical protein